MQVKIKKLSETAITPSYGSDGAAAFDLYADSVLKTKDYIIVGTGISFEIPEGFYMKIESRSGLGFKARWDAFGGVVDSDYRGEVKVMLNRNVNGLDLSISKGDRVAQAIIRPVVKVDFIESDCLSDTDRGNSGFGSTGE